MYTYYLIRLDFADGHWGYVRWVGHNQFELTDDPNSCMVFDSHDEAADYFYDHIKGKSRGDGAPIHKVFITTITSQYRM